MMMSLRAKRKDGKGFFRPAPFTQQYKLKTVLEKFVGEAARGDAMFIVDSATDFIDGKVLSNGNGILRQVTQ